MMSQIALALVQWEHEQEVQEAIRRRRLLAGEGPDPDRASVVVAARLRRRERIAQPARLSTP